MLDLEQHLKRQIAFSRATWGPSTRMLGVIDHIRKELIEVEESDGSPEEWTDVVILALDGLTRSLLNRGRTVDRAAEAAVELIVEKQGRNELRDWPDWRTASADKAIEHTKVQEEDTHWMQFCAFMSGYVDDGTLASSEQIRTGVMAVAQNYPHPIFTEVQEKLYKRLAKDHYENRRFVRCGHSVISEDTHRELIEDVVKYLDQPYDRVKGWVDGN